MKRTSAHRPLASDIFVGRCITESAIRMGSDNNIKGHVGDRREPPKEGYTVSITVEGRTCAQCRQEEMASFERNVFASFFPPLPFPELRHHL